MKLTYNEMALKAREYIYDLHIEKEITGVDPHTLIESHRTKQIFNDNGWTLEEFREVSSNIRLKWEKSIKGRITKFYWNLKWELQFLWSRYVQW